MLQSPYEHINLARKESAPRRRRFGIGRFLNREAERLNRYQFYPFTAPAVTPPTICFCIATKNTKLGIMDITMPGRACSQSAVCAENCIYKAFWIFIAFAFPPTISWFVIISFHVASVSKTTTVVKIGFNRGSTILKYIRSGDAPSIRAHSSSSIGTFFTTHCFLNLAQEFFF